MKTARNSFANRNLLVARKRKLADFSKGQDFECFSAGDNVERLEPFTFTEKDGCFIGQTGLRVTTAKDARAKKSVFYTPAAPLDLSITPALLFMFSSYDGERDAQYFRDISENKILQDGADPLLLSRSYLSVTLFGKGKRDTRTVYLNRYGYNRLCYNFCDCPFLSSVDKIEICFHADEDAPEWQGVLKITPLYAGKIIDFGLAGSGLETEFCAENGEVAHNGGVLTFSFKRNAAFTFPSLADAKNTLYNVELSVKNTICFYMRSTSGRAKFTLCFSVEGGTEFPKANAKSFDFRGLKEPKLVYCNLSDIPSARGRLTGLKLIPEGEGSYEIFKISFEEEDKIERFVGRIGACRAVQSSQTIEICGNVYDRAFSQIKIYRIFPHILTENLGELTLLGCGSADCDGNFHVEFPWKTEKGTLFSSQFLAVAETEEGETGKLFPRATIENWKDFVQWDFIGLPKRKVYVDRAPYFAKGDGYSDDTAAIQRAIDDMSVSGGGKVVVRGNKSFYGRRYRVTKLYLKSNVELHLEEGAILWENDDLAQYETMPAFGHNAALTGINWAANSRCGNYPMIYALGERNIKLTGKGKLRMWDVASVSPDGHFDFIGDNVCVGCEDRAHVTPIGFCQCDHFEISDVSIIRSSAAHICVLECSEGLIANVSEDHCKCTGADGVWPMGGHDILISFCRFNINDDGIVFGSSFCDPRDILWMPQNPGRKGGMHDITVEHCYIYAFYWTGRAISFCTWGTDDPVLSNQAIKRIVVRDNILQGNVAVGGYFDNPYNGAWPYDGMEQDDYSPVQEILLENNEYWSPVTLGPVKATSCLTDCGILSSENFVYGDFMRRETERRPYWITNLANWSYDEESAVSEITFYGKRCGRIEPIRDKACNLFQGLYLRGGVRKFSLKAQLSGKAGLFVRDLRTKRMICSEEICGDGVFGAKKWKEYSWEFALDEDVTADVGVWADQKECRLILFTDCTMR